MRFLPFLLLFSCASPAPFHRDSRELPGERWHRDSLLSFLIYLPDAEPFSLSLFVRHSTDLSHSNLACIVSLTRDGWIIDEQRVDIQLADSDGRWYGRGAFLKSLLHPLPRPFHPDSAGSYRVQVRHWMRPLQLRGITNIGIQAHE